MTGNLAMIPARGGSKGIPNKNIRLIAGKPLCAWAIEAAVESGVFSQVIVSTDSDLISSVVESLNLNVDILRRPDELASDSASTESVMLHFLEHFKPDILTTIQVTNPLVTAEDFQNAYRQFMENDLDSLLSGAISKHFYWSNDGVPLNYDPNNRPRRQDFSGVYMENGSFYMTTRSTLEKFRCRLGGRIGIYEMPEHTGVDIDTETDWKQTEALIYEHKIGSLVNNYDIRLVVSDVDGVLTDAGMYYDKDGERLKKFNTHDGKGFELLQNAGIKTALITSENSDIVRRRAEKLKIDYLYSGVTNTEKLDKIQEICLKEQITNDKVAYIGDDINCTEALLGVGLAACPSNALPKIKSIPGIFNLSKAGGDGAFRELVDMILGSSSQDRGNDS